MDLAIREVWIPDFRQDRLIRRHVGIQNGRILRVSQNPFSATTVIDGNGGFLTPGLTDAHVHIESALVTPLTFGETVARHGTLYAVADCHEIANVAGMSGLCWFMDDARDAPATIFFAAPSSVPASPFGTSGGSLSPAEIARLLDDPRVVSLGELMNVPGVLERDETIMRMVALAKERNKRVNGHASGLTGEKLREYFSAGIEDDHETSSYRELKERLTLGIHLFLREGSAEHTKENSYGILDEEPGKVLFCTDDKTLYDIETTGHITFHLRKGARLGVATMNLLRAACFNGPAYYHIPNAGEIREGYRADLVLFDNATDFTVQEVVVGGRLLRDISGGESNVPPFLADSIQLERPVAIPPIPKGLRGLAIGVEEGTLITARLSVNAHLPEFSTEKDLLKLVVMERYGHGNRAACRVHGFGLKQGALASSLAHDCHNIVAVGAEDDSIRLAVEAIVGNRGGLTVVDGEEVFTVPLAVGGIVSTERTEKIVTALDELTRRARKLGTSLRSPHATLSFMALEVIPHLKLTDQGLFDVDRFQFVTDH